MKPVLLRLKANWEPHELKPVLEALRREEVVIAPTDTVYGLLAPAFSPAAFAALDSIKGNRESPYALVFDSVAGFKKWYGELNPFRRRTLEELLPGPATVVLPAPPFLSTNFRYESGRIAVRVCSDRLFPELARQLGKPLWATSANRTGAPAPTEFQRVDPALVTQVSLSVDLGATIYRQPSTVVDLTRLPFKVIREGAGLERCAAVLGTAHRPLHILVVCTGNVCRSPLMAATIAHLVGEAGASGIRVASAGIRASPGYPATPDMVDIAAGWGVDLTGHQAVQITPEMLIGSDLILAAEPEHRDFISALVPEVSDRVRLAGEPVGLAEIPDPFGISRDFYLQTAGLIRNVSQGWADSLRAAAEEVGWQPSLQPQTADRFA